MIISLIVAFANRRVIGSGQSIPWSIPADMAWFKKNTLNKTIVMGRKTFESIGRALPQRTNIVLSSQKIEHSGIVWSSNIANTLEMLKDEEEIMIIGGGEIYKQFLPLAHRLYLTHIDIDIEGDVYFPDYEPNEWELLFSEFHDNDGSDTPVFCFEILQRRST